jgi:hypothetical protein
MSVEGYEDGKGYSVRGCSPNRASVIGKSSSGGDRHSSKHLQQLKSAQSKLFHNYYF